MFIPRTFLPALLLALLIPSLAAAAKPPVYLPLVVVEAASWGRAPEVPLITVGSLPNDALPSVPAAPDPITHSDQAQWDTFELKSDRDAPIGKILAGRIRFTSAPRADAPAFVLLAAPMLNIRQCWVPTAIRLEGNTATLEVNSWDVDMTGDSEKNFDRRAAYLISLGKLPIGTYRLTLHCSHLSATEAKGFQYSGADDRASTSFTVGAPKPQPPSTIAVKDLQTTYAPAIPPSFIRITPRHWALLADVAAFPPPTLQIGTYDPNVHGLFKELYLGHERQDAVPTPQGAAGHRFPLLDFAAIVSYPSLRPGEWIALHSIEYSPDHHAITITVDYWHDRSLRAASAGHDAPFLIIPELTYDLTPSNVVANRSKGDFTITLQWRSLLAESPGKPYTLQSGDPKDKSLAPVTEKFSIYNP